MNTCTSNEYLHVSTTIHNIDVTSYDGEPYKTPYDNRDDGNDCIL